jgi:predicted dehydrogenase
MAESLALQPFPRNSHSAGTRKKRGVDVPLHSAPMKLLWRGLWIDTPGYAVQEPGVLVDVETALPLLLLGNASGRSTRRPQRKVATFLVTDGPQSTLRKVRTKRDEPRFTGDFRVSLVLGRTIPDGRRVLALAGRVPPAAQQLSVHRGLMREVDDGWSDEDLGRVGSALASEGDVLGNLCRQNYLYSSMEPPEELTKLFDDAIGRLPGLPRVSAARRTELIHPTKGTGEAADTVLRLDNASGPEAPGLPVAVLGAGDYARTEIIPAVLAADLTLYSVANREPQIAAIVGREHGFAVATTDSERAIAELPRPGLVVVATAHDSHAHLACLAAEAGHRVFLEKPPTVTPEDVARLQSVMTQRRGMVEIGFNRRYHPLVRRARERLRQEQGPTSISCTIKEITLQPDHWYFWENQGTRITGNLCHWIDLAVFFLDGRPLPVSVTLSPRLPGSLAADDEERVLTVTFDDGSLLTILATSRGDDIRGVQEDIDIRRGRTTVNLDDLWKMRVRSGGIERYSRTLFRHKAHGEMYDEALGRVARGEPAAYPVGDMVVVSAIQIAASDLVRSDERVGEIPGWLAPALQRLS